MLLLQFRPSQKHSAATSSTSPCRWPRRSQLRRSQQPPWRTVPEKCSKRLWGMGLPRYVYLKHKLNHLRFNLYQSAVLRERCWSTTSGPRKEGKESRRDWGQQGATQCARVEEELQITRPIVVQLAYFVIPLDEIDITWHSNYKKSDNDSNEFGCINSLFLLAKYLQRQLSQRASSEHRSSVAARTIFSLALLDINHSCKTLFAPSHLILCFVL